MSKFEYVRLADAVAAEIEAARSSRATACRRSARFAYQRKIAASTASRVYTELLRRGLVVGEVGRGTFISGEARRGIAAPTEPRGARIDLEINYPLLPKQSALIAKSLEALNRPEALDRHCDRRPAPERKAARNAAAQLSRPRKPRLVAKARADGVHRQRPAMHRGGSCRGGAGRRPLRRRGPDLSLHQGHRRAARRHAGAAGDG